MAALARERFAPRAALHDRESSFPVENYQDLRAAGLLGLMVPRAYGGLEADPLTYALCLLEIARGCSATALTFNMHCTVLGLLDALGSEAQRRRYFGDVVERGALVASITSEPESSFRDRFVLQTLFHRENDGWRVSGLKHFCSLGDAADYYFISGILEGTDAARDGLVSAMLPRATSGITVEGRWDALGMRGTISHTIRYDSHLAENEIVGAPGQLLRVDLSGFALGYAAVYLGIGEAAFDFVQDFARTRTFKPSTEPLSHHPLTQRTVAEMATMLRAAKLLLREAAALRGADDREAAALAVNQSKYLSAEVGLDVTTRAIRLAGGRGILKELPLERWHRDAMAGPVMPPSNDRCLETAGRLLFGLRAATLDYL